MINRWIGIVTLGLMLSANAALLMRDFLPDWMAGAPPISRAQELRDGEEINIQFGLYNREGHRIGHSWTYSTRHGELVSIQHRTVIDALSLPLDTGLETVRIDTRLNYREQSRLDELSVQVFGLGIWIKLEGEFYLPDDFACKWQVGAQRGEFQLPAHVTRAMGDMIRPFESLTDLYVGKTWRLEVLNPLSGLVPDWGVRNMTTTGLLVRVTGTEEIEYRGVPVEAFVIESEGIRAWVTPAGRVIRQELELPLLGTLLLVDEPYDESLRGQSSRGGLRRDTSSP
jgi:hypothetical protein